MVIQESPFHGMERTKKAYCGELARANCHELSPRAYRRKIDALAEQCTDEERRILKRIRRSRLLRFVDGWRRECARRDLELRRNPTVEVYRPDGTTDVYRLPGAPAWSDWSVLRSWMSPQAPQAARTSRPRQAHTARRSNRTNAPPDSEPEPAPALPHRVEPGRRGLTLHVSHVSPAALRRLERGGEQCTR